MVSLKKELDWLTLFLWLGLSLIGLIAIYSATQGPVSEFLPTVIQNNFWKQLFFVGLSIGLLFSLQFINPSIFKNFSYVAYGVSLLLMIYTLFFGQEINGAKSWLRFGGFGLQSSEFMKITTILAAANYLTSRRNLSAEKIRYALVSFIIILVPTGLVIAQNDFGTAIIFIALIPVILFWSGLPYGVALLMISPAIILYLSVFDWTYGAIALGVLTIAVFFIQKSKWLTLVSLVMGTGTIAAVHFALTNVLQPHQVARIIAFTNPSYDPTGAGWNVIQAKTAIGSGGWLGKGFLEGTQTQLRFLPEQWTDFIFCVVGEEFGFLGASILIIVFMLFLLRLLHLSINHKHPFAQLVTLSVASVYFMHFFINVGSATALLPVIGIPLPFISYGGSAFIANTLMLAICLNLDLYKREFSIYS